MISNQEKLDILKKINVSSQVLNNRGDGIPWIVKYLTLVYVVWLEIDVHEAIKCVERTIYNGIETKL